VLFTVKLHLYDHLLIRAEVVILAGWS